MVQLKFNQTLAFAVWSIVGLGVVPLLEGSPSVAVTLPEDSSGAIAPSIVQQEWSSLTAEVSAELELVQYLTSINARMFGAYWCPYCARQREEFGDAFAAITYVECDARGENAQPELCRETGIRGYPTWEINGELYTGLKTLEELAELSGYTGSTDFGN
jgi:glutaredoxin